MSPPRTSRISSPESWSRSRPRWSTWPPIVAFGTRISRITASIETVFPDPDSPTIPTTSPSPIESERPSTAETTPSSVRNETVRSLTSSSGSGMPDPRVEQRVDEIDDGVREYDEKRGVDHGREDHWQVKVLERVEGQLADPVQSEDDFGQERAAADERAEVEAEEANEDDQRRPQRMADQHAPLGEPLGAGGADVVL